MLNFYRLLKIILGCLFLFILFTPTQLVAQDKEELLSKAQQEEKDGNLNNALFYLNQFHDDFKPTTESWLTAYRIYLKIADQPNNNSDVIYSNTNQAIESFKKAIKLSNTSRALTDFFNQEKIKLSSLLTQWGSVYFDKKEFTKALKLAENAIELNSYSIESYELALFSTSEMNQTARFIELSENYRTSFSQQISPKIIELCLEFYSEHLGIQEADNWANQAKDFVLRNQSKNLVRKLSSFHTLSGNYSIDKKQYDKAIEHFQEVVSLTDDEWYRISLAKMYAFQQNWQQAEFELNTVFLPEISKVEILSYYASVHRMIFINTNRVVTEPKDWIINASLNWMKPYFQGLYLTSSEKYEEARNWVQQSIDQRSNYKPSLELQGHIYLKLAAAEQNDTYFSKALTLLKTALRFDPSDSDLRTLIEELESD